MNFFEVSQRLVDALGLAQPPVAVTFSTSSEFDKPSGPVPAGCRFWQDAAERTFATTAADHRSCAVGMYTHNLEQTPDAQADLSTALAVFRDLGYLTEADLPLIPVLQMCPQYVVYGPLSQASVAPAVVLLFVNAAQALIASEAAQQLENRLLPALGRPACAVVPSVANSETAALSFGCCGARAYLDNFTPETAIFAIPGSKLELYTERLQSLARANSTLRAFHQLRRTQIAAGLAPSVEESLSALKNG
ncbi:MAG TPA: DUF169 domain-containing protein [Bryobacteraceae bacterium]|nr:DUF169 domain-containing protein [Bryobacteraceae bacterium]